MKITPQDIHHKEFKRALRGYSEEDVDLFLDQLAEQYENLYKQNHTFEEEIHQLKDKIKTYTNMELTLQNTLLTAQKSAEEVQMNAKKEASVVVNNANLEAKNALEKAEKQKQALNETFAKLKNLEGSFKTRIRTDLESLLSKLKNIEQQEDDFLQQIEKEFASVEEIEIPKVEKEVLAEAKAAAESIEEKAQVADSKKEDGPKEPSKTPVSAEVVSASKADASKSDIASEEEIDKFLQQEPVVEPSNDNGNGSSNGEEKKNGLLGRIFGRKDEAEADEAEPEIEAVEVAAVPAKKKGKAKKSKKQNTEEIG